MKEFATLLVREKLLQQIFVELNNFTELKPSIDVVLKYVKVLTSCESVGIRLKDEKGQAPYYTYNGFSEEFIEHENDICSYDSEGNTKQLEDGACALQCMCGLILNSNSEYAADFLTPGGSFWTNDSSTLLSCIPPTEKERLSIRGYCVSCGYSSIALIPIRHNGTIIGVLQLNDRTQNKFNEEAIYYLEMVGIQLGISIYNRQTYSTLLSNYKELQRATIK